MPAVSKHAIKRIRQRLGINKRAAETEAQRAAEHGLSPSDLTGSVRRYIDHLAMRHHGTYRITPRGIFSYKGDTLTTVWPVPQRYHKSVMSRWEKQNA
jgi:hypothetical protein